MCREISYHLMPAYVFYFTSMSMNINLQKLVEKMHKKDEEYDWLENLTSTVSHEMRTPLGIILQNAQRLVTIIPNTEEGIHKLLMMIF